MPCNPNDVSFDTPDGPSGPSIPGFGTPFALDNPDLNPLPDGFPENLLELFEKLRLLIPPGALRPQLNPNFSKDVFDAIMKILDQFMPFLMLYKFFLPILELIICIIEVLCALMNPFKLIRALNRLFTQCIPDFLNLFPIFALIVMIISLLLLILALIEYIITQIIRFILFILRNLIALILAFEGQNGPAIKAIAFKLGSILCIFQNLFVLFAIFNIIIQVIKDILSLIFAIPPCDDGDPNDEDGCCTPDVCPDIVKQPYTRSTGTFKYLPKVAVQTSLILSPVLGPFTQPVRNESWQLFDAQQSQSQAFRNIFDAYDVTVDPKPIFFPTDATYTSSTDYRQVPYTVDLRMFYNPANWGRTGNPRYIRFKKCIITNVPTTSLTEGNLSTTQINNGVVVIAGGTGYEDDGNYKLPAYAADGITTVPNVSATIENFFHMPTTISTEPDLSINDGYNYFNIEYTFTPNIAPLLSKNIVTLGCVPSIATNRAFINEIFAGDIGFKTKALSDLVNSDGFPNPGEAQECMSAASDALRSNFTVEGVAVFQATTLACLDKLKGDIYGALKSMVSIGCEPCKSKISTNLKTQFTSKGIKVIVDLNERNGAALTGGFPQEVGDEIAKGIKGHVSFGEISNFTYDGYQSFTADITSILPGSGTLMVSFENNTLCDNKFPETGAVPVHSLQEINYQFIYTPVGSSIPVVGTGEGDTDGTPRRNEGDVGRDTGGGGKDGVGCY